LNPAPGPAVAFCGLYVDH